MKKLPKLRVPKIKIKKPALDYKKLAIRFTVLGALLLIITGVVAYNRLYMTPERRFWMAIQNSLQTRSVVRTVESGGTGNKTIENSRFNFGFEATINRITSVGSKNATTESNVTTQNILTPTAQYVRYTNISTSEKKADGTAYNFEPVLGVWAEQAQATTPEEAEQLKLSFVQPQVTLAPFANLNARDRNAILNELKNNGVYEIDFKNTGKQEVDGREFIVYPAKVKLKKYVAVLQHTFDLMGYGSFPPLNADSYPEKARYNAKFLVDPRDNVITGIMLDNQTEKYTNYGTNIKAPIPSSTIQIKQLQEQLESLQ